MNQAAEPGRLAVQSVFWRRCIDWIVLHLPAWLHPPLIIFSTLIFFVAAGPARRTVRHHLGIIFPESSSLTNLVRALRVFYDFAWTLTDSAVYRLLKEPFSYELEGSEFLDQLAVAQGAIVLTAHMGNYDLGSAVFVEKLHREIKIVRAPEPDAAAAEHLGRAIEEAAAGGVKVAYNTGGLLSFDLLNALRSGEIISIQGDRAMGDVAQFPATMFGQPASLPSGPIVLARTAEVPIFPLFVVRTAYRRYRIITRAPFTCARKGASREADIAEGVQRWADILAGSIRQYWPQWHAFTPVFASEFSRTSL
jgi:lauroyl/myristoyl acyltransferase